MNWYIAGVDYLKQLDDVLWFLDDGDRPNTAFSNIRKEFKDISSTNLERVLEKLCKDGHAGEEPEPGGPPYYWITYDGLIFRSYGGYKGEDRAKRQEARKRDIVDYGIVFAGVGALLSVVYLFGSAFWDYLYPCCCY